jgi:hypothetical protein
VAGERPRRLDLSRPRTYGELFQTTLAIFGSHADVLLTLALLLVAPATLVVDGIWGRALADGVDARPPVASQAVSAALSVFVILPLVTASTALAVRGLGEGTPPGDVGTVLKAGARAFPRVLGAVVLYLVAVLAGFVLFIVPGIWLAIRCYFVVQGAAIEGLGPAAAMRGSSELVQGMWWRTCGCLVATGFLLGVTGSIAISAVGSSGNGALFVAGTTVVESVAMALTAIFATLLYFDLRARRERPDDVLP